MNKPPNETSFTAELRGVVGRRNIECNPTRMQPYLNGYRIGGGPALAVVRPGTLVELWQVLQRCIKHDKIIVLQAANTGLTGGSTPFGNYDRDVVLINVARLTGLHMINGGKEAVCLPGSTLNQLQAVLAPLGREPHSVIGSSCIGASVIGGICNNSGGALVRRGPAYTERAIFARLDEHGGLHLINHLGINLHGSPEEQLALLEEGRFETGAIEHTRARSNAPSDYEAKVRAIDRDSPARHNGDPERLYEASGSGGRIAVFAVRVPTFPADRERRIFYIGSNDPKELTTVRRDMLSKLRMLPVAAEYLHRDCFDVANRYGKDSFLAIRLLGTRRLPALFALKRGIDRFASHIFKRPLSDHLLQSAAALFPTHLPKRMRDFRNRFEHHLILETSDEGIAEARNYLGALYPSPSGDVFECTEKEATSALLHRFVAAGAAIRYRMLHADDVEGLISLDFALRRNDQEWSAPLPPSIASRIEKTLRYGHYFCHVFHHDYLVKKGCDLAAVKADLLTMLEDRRAAYPAEHNVGHLYAATPALSDFYRDLDPTNTFNPGIGLTSRRRDWA